MARVSVSLSAKREPKPPLAPSADRQRPTGAPATAERQRGQQQRDRDRAPTGARDEPRASEARGRAAQAASVPASARRGRPSSGRARAASSARRSAASDELAARASPRCGRPARRSRRGLPRSAAPRRRARAPRAAAVHVGDRADVEAPGRLVGKQDARGRRGPSARPRISFCMLPPDSRRMRRRPGPAAHVEGVDDRSSACVRIGIAPQEAAALERRPAIASRATRFSAIAMSPTDAVVVPVLRNARDAAAPRHRRGAGGRAARRRAARSPAEAVERAGEHGRQAPAWPLPDTPAMPTISPPCTRQRRRRRARASGRPAPSTCVRSSTGGRRRRAASRRLDRPRRGRPSVSASVARSAPAAERRATCAAAQHRDAVGDGAAPRRACG